jgi:hypothetical protein
MLDGLLTWRAHSEHKEVWAGPSWSSFALKVHSLLLPGFQNPSASGLLQEHSMTVHACLCCGVQETRARTQQQLAEKYLQPLVKPKAKSPAKAPAEAKA